MDDMGILVKKSFLNKDDMNKLKFSKNETGVISSKDSFIQDFLIGLRQKINDPLGQKNRLNYPATTANNNKATIFVILIIGLTAGPAVSL